MNSKTLNNWMQFLASIGVILSLIFIGVQIQQSREIAIADIYQQRTALLLQHFSFSVPAEITPRKAAAELISLPEAADDPRRSKYSTVRSWDDTICPVHVLPEKLSTAVCPSDSILLLRVTAT